MSRILPKPFNIAESKNLAEIKPEKLSVRRLDKKNIAPLWRRGGAGD